MSQRRTPCTSVRLRRFLLVLPLLFVASLALPIGAAARDERDKPGTYHNPLQPQIPGDGVVESCADPTVFRGQQPGDNYWYMFCTTDPLNDTDRTGTNFNFHLIPMMRSLDLVNWTYVGDAF